MFLYEGHRVKVKVTGTKNIENLYSRNVKLTDLHIYVLDAVPPVHVVWNHVDADKLTTADGGTFTSSSASLSNQSR